MKRSARPTAIIADDEPRLADYLAARLAALSGRTVSPITPQVLLVENAPGAPARLVRRWLGALDREALVHGLWRDTVETTETLLPPGHWARLEDLPPLRRDLPEARRLLDAAGYPDPGNGQPRLTLTLTPL